MWPVNREEQTLIETRGLTKSFNGRSVVDGLTVRAEKGEILGILGPNGAGKTTTVRMLATLIAPTAGEAFIGGRRLGVDDTAIRRRIGILTETPGLYEGLTAYRNLDFYGRLYGVPDRERSARIRHYLEQFGLWERRKERVNTYSKGMKQRLAIARALIHEPDVLLLDEPTSGLDPEAARTVRDSIAALSGQGRTIILCTHNLEEADHLCDRIAIFRRSVIRLDTAEGLRRELFGRKVIVDLASVPDEVLAAVRRLSFVRQLEVDGNSLVAAIDNPERDNPELVRAVVQSGGEIRFVSEKRYSLEDVYLRLVGEASLA